MLYWLRNKRQHNTSLVWSIITVLLTTTLAAVATTLSCLCKLERDSPAALLWLRVRVGSSVPFEIRLFATHFQNLRALGIELDMMSTQALLLCARLERAINLARAQVRPPLRLLLLANSPAGEGGRVFGPPLAPLRIVQSLRAKLILLTSLIVMVVVVRREADLSIARGWRAIHQLLLLSS